MRATRGRLGEPVHITQEKQHGEQEADAARQIVIADAESDLQSDVESIEEWGSEAGAAERLATGGFPAERLVEARFRAARELEGNELLTRAE